MDLLTCPAARYLLTANPFCLDLLQKQSMVPGSAATNAASAATAAAAGGSAGKPEFIFVTSVPGLFYLNPSTRAYEGKGVGNIGCVVVGSGLSYSLMLYDASKQTLLACPVNQHSVSSNSSSRSHVRAGR